jgi:hypothetical protein
MLYGHFRNLKHILEHSSYTVDIENGYVRNKKGQRVGFFNNADGTRRVALWAYGESFTYAEHNIVAVAAGHDLTNKKVIHIDGDKWNNSIHNLKIVENTLK